MQAITIPYNIRAILHGWAAATDYVLENTGIDADVKARLEQCRDALEILGNAPSTVTLIHPEISFSRIRFIIQILSLAKPKDPDKVWQQIYDVATWMKDVEAEHPNGR